MAAKLFAYGADVDAAGGYDGSARCAATYRGNKTVINLLLDHGAKMNHRVQHSWTALHVASHQGYEDIVQLLLHREADITAKTEDGSSTLDLAIARMRKGVVKLLLQNSATTLVDQCCLRNALDLLKQAWYSISEDWECTNYDDIAHFAQAQECKEDIKQLLTQYSTI